MRNIFLPLKKRKQLPVETICRNCQTQLQGPYCHKCGQNLFIGSKRTFGELSISTLENIFAFDNKILTTLKLLLFFPGKLTKEYINGRIVRYVHPSKLFWFISLIFFTVLTMSIKQNNINIKKEGNISNMIENTQSNPGKEKYNAEIKIGKADTEKIDQTVKQIIALPENVTFQNYISTYSPYVAFLLIPFFAFLLFIFYRNRSYYYADYLAFALHLHSFAFIIFSIYLGLGMIFGNLKLESIVFFYIPMIYFIIASYTVFRPGKISLIAKSLSIAIIFGFMILIVLALFFVILIYLSINNK